MTETTTAGDAQVYEIPRDWLAVELGELCSIISGYGFPKSYQGKAEGQLPFFKVGDISRVVASGQHRLVQAQHYISQDESIELKATPLPKGTVVFAKIGEAIKLNRRAILAQDSLIDNNVMGLHAPSASLNQQYLYYWMLTVKFDEISRATAVPSIRKSDVEQLLMPFPPLNEQRRIVEKIEELFTKLDAGVRSLKQARGQLKSYRRSVLKAAVEGELSREWREAHRDELEPASELLDRILQERREKFTGKKYKEPASPDISELPALPDGWASATVDQLSREVRYGSSAKTNEESNGIPVLRMGNIKDGQLVTNALKYLPEAHGEFPELLLEPGDLLFNRTNSSELVGKTAIYTGTPEPSSFASYLIRVRFLSEVLPDFVSYFINSIYGRQWISSVVSQQVGQANVNGTKLKALRVPLPPTKEQRFIVEEVERRLSVVDKLEATVEENLKQAADLRRSILKQAFSGELVPQDPDDEPASVLLARIRSEREATKQKAKRPRKVREDDEAQARLI